MVKWTGTAGDDNKDLSDKADVAHGGGGVDMLQGFGGNDRLYGDSGDDFLFGGGGADRLFGGTGDDMLAGHDGNDTLNGGAGADIFDFSNHGHRSMKAGNDVISDFDAVEGDRLHFQGDSGIHGMADLKIADNKYGDAVVSWDGGSVTLEGVQAVSVDATYFQF